MCVRERERRQEKGKEKRETERYDNWAQGWKFDAVIHDGAPNVGGATWYKDAYGQVELVRERLRCMCASCVCVSIGVCLCLLCVCTEFVVASAIRSILRPS